MPTCDLQGGDAKIKEVRRYFKYLGCVLTENEECVSEIRTCIGLDKDAIQKLSTVLKTGRIR